MKTSVIKKHILEGLAPYVEEYGFKILESQFEIVRKDKISTVRQSGDVKTGIYESIGY